MTNLPPDELYGMNLAWHIVHSSVLFRLTNCRDCASIIKT